jgi:hypothetical protein
MFFVEKNTSRLLKSQVGAEGRWKFKNCLLGTRPATGQNDFVGIRMGCLHVKAFSCFFFFCVALRYLAFNFEMGRRVGAVKFKFSNF